MARVLQVEVGHLTREAGGKSLGKGGLADLTRADQPHNGELAEKEAEAREMRGTLNHSTILP